MNDRQKIQLTFAAVLAALLIVLGMTGSEDFAEEQRQVSVYCEMVGLWTEDARLGVEPNNRRGWPPYNGTEVCQ